ncbi:MAG: TRAP transporter small permease subunit [Chiayiivirga sp.]|jgi:TRAP-type mannitol/chloroaromatic compound transport system permease small subunit|uniref:TRAP transporter small permease subunit n=1 Tax=Chiayiivirga sp. TaxID=2041042 RepID=UPI0025C6C415|nr:TRAP transporter small permease subunit [Chiayiivirga sp.]MCI1711082.1 TRAP transporter small permease subunit [Chiayiivirga sp.]MCI1728120.1 TRAP transporter small permease subunit [Chiayiivirga sp.]
MIARLANGIDRGVDALGRALSWLTLILVVLSFGLVLARYALGIGSIAGQESVLWLHSLVFLLGAAYALRHGQHVRVDLLYQRFSPRGKAWADLLGTLVFLLPFCAFMLWVSLDYVAASWSQHEASREPGGLPGVFVLKTLIPVAAALLALQGASLCLRALLALRGESR